MSLDKAPIAPSTNAKQGKTPSAIKTLMGGVALAVLNACQVNMAPPVQYAPQNVVRSTSTTTVNTSSGSTQVTTGGIYNGPGTTVHNSVQMVVDGGSGGVTIEKNGTGGSVQIDAEKKQATIRRGSEANIYINQNGKVFRVVKGEVVENTLEVTVVTIGGEEQE